MPGSTEFSMSPELTEKVKSIEINQNKNFMNGEETSSFGNTANSNVKEQSEISSEVVMEASTYITQVMTNLLSNAITHITSLSIIGELPNVVATYTLAYTKSIGEIVAELKSGPIDKKNEQQEKEAQEKEKSEMLNNISEAAKKLSEKHEKIMGTVEEKLNSITSYITAGADWVNRKVNDFTYNLIKNCDKDFSDKSAEIEEKKRKWVNETGKKTGMAAAEQINKVTKFDQKYIIDKAKRLIEVATKKALALAQTLIMKLVGLLGA